ncbi:RDD family protein [Danxiaibacter flavus]|uniref:RDD family protein n=1 Tax=Danxiaibacter flavus TaxID=3049108 RepID=A0ABV3ZMF5_9BACT|nr:RDD family protein [Chitinophagaceae bacterium DXS]
MYPPENESSLLEIELELELNKEPATKGQRLVNCIIDTIIYLISWYVLMATIVTALNLMGSMTDSYTDTIAILFSLSPCLLYVPFYAFSEWISRGRSVGKFITKTKTIRLDGSKFTFKDALLRSLIRLIPIEPFTAFSNRGPWHDRWTKTRVVKK